MKSGYWKTSVWSVLVVVSISVCLDLAATVSIGGAQESASRSRAARRPVTVPDTIEMTRIAGDSHYDNALPLPPLVYFSPDGSRFVIVLRTGNLERNSNDYSMLLFWTADALAAPKWKILVQMSTSSNNDALRHIQWVSNDTIAFLGEDGKKPTQLYTFDLKKWRLDQRTDHATDVSDYRVNANGEVLFLAESHSLTKRGSTEQENGVIVTSQQLGDILETDHASTAVAKLFSRKREKSEVELTGHQLPAREAISGGNSPRQNREVATASVSISVEEDMNTPQRLYIKDLKTKRKAMFLELNPQFSQLNLAKVELVTWRGTDGKEILNGGGLYLPPDYVPGKKYPLVIQTHHFQKDMFMIDGPWSSGYAAQALAAKGIVVLEVHHAAGYYDHKPTEAPSEMAMYEGAIDYLDGRGLIDRSRVGIFAFSRTVYHVAYTLTHSNYPFAAAIMEDGVDGGYFQYLAYPSLAKEYEPIYGGPAWGAARGKWVDGAPGFNLDKVKTPIRIMEHGRAGALEQWEWFSGLRLLHKPVDMVVLPNSAYGEHLLKRPSEQMASQQGAVDWFCFWLKGEEDPDPAKAGQYERWRELRKLQQTTKQSN